MHAHLHARYEWEPPERIGRPVFDYPDEVRHAPDAQLGPRHDALRALGGVGAIEPEERGAESGEGVGPFACQAPPARVLYIDFELSKAQFGQRYRNGDEDHEGAVGPFRPRPLLATGRKPPARWHF